MTSIYPIIKDQDWISPVTYNLLKRFNYDGCGIDWATVRVLDVGCNVGNYVNWANNVVSRENYVGLDINEKFINIARMIHPEYQFVHCNKWHRSYNPTGIKNLSIRDSLSGEFDIVVLNSVFSHANADEIRAEILDIFTVLKPGGISYQSMNPTDVTSITNAISIFNTNMSYTNSNLIIGNSVISIRSKFFCIPVLPK